MSGHHTSAAAAPPESVGGRHPWRLLERELDAWAALGRRATLWCRDDDACRDSAALRRLLGIACAHRVPIGIAAIPSAIDRSLVEAIARSAAATILQHGYAHRNHASTGQRSSEFGSHRALRVRLDELERGRGELARAFGGRFAAILVPPWNRIGDDLVPCLSASGFAGLSRFGPRTNASPAPALREVNTHVDLIAWRRGRVFIGADAALERLVAHLAARRLGDVDADEPTGLLTHHLAFDAMAFDFVDALFARSRAHRAAAWVDVAHAFDARNTMPA